MAVAIFPIRELSAYQNGWTIKARVTSKAPLRTFQGGKNGGGKVFHVDLLDAEGGEIRASFFNSAADSFNDRLQVGKVFTLSKGSVKIANKQYNTTNHRYELTFESDAQVEEVPDDAAIKTEKFEFSDMRDLQTRTLPCRVDLLGIVTAFRDVVNLKTKDGKDLVKREITVADDSGISMSVALFGDMAAIEESKLAGNAVVAMKGVSVKEWNGGRAGSLGDSGKLVVSPDYPQAAKVREWWATTGSSQELTQLSVAGGSGGGGGGRYANVKTVGIGQVRELTAPERIADQAELFNCVGRLALVQMRKQGEKLPVWYNACGETREFNGRAAPCNKRVDDANYCPACSRQVKTTIRLMSRCRFVDNTDSIWLTTFHEAALNVLGHTPEMIKAIDEEGKDALEAKFKSLYFRRPLQITVRAKPETYQGEARVNVSVVDARQVSYAEHGKKLLGEIQEMLAVN